MGLRHSRRSSTICPQSRRRGRRRAIHGHSLHHPLAIEAHAGRPILYGCGDFINDYEG
ncbi:CapA family protein [Mesorhizobium tianshanense]|uniref:CapA family protein n=1 Tax=Mesorhizobium tianshanense TaxID=39844 RepID=UPI001ABF429C